MTSDRIHASDGRVVSSPLPGGWPGETPVRIYPLVSRTDDQRRLTEWLGSIPEYETVDPERPLADADFDLCILDVETLQNQRETLRSRKSAEDPVLLPVLLLFPNTDASVIDIERGRIADNVMLDTVDEVVSLPLKTAELTWRTKALLRLRAQSLRLHARTRELEMYERIVQRIDDPIMFQDMDGRFRVVNDAVATYAGMTEDQLVGTDEFAFMDEESARYIDARKQQVVEQERPIRYSISPTVPETSSKEFSTVRYPHYGPDGTLRGTVAICRDITELHRRDRQLEILDRILRHNLRNDMNVIEMFAGSIQSSTTGETASQASRIVDKSKQIRRTVDKQRDITQFLSEPPAEQPLDLCSLLDRLVDRFSRQFPDASLSLTAPENCQLTITGGIETALAELVENAIIHSDRDIPTVEVTATRHGDEIDVVVADDGPTIPEMEREILTRGAEVEPLYHGSGLGLWFVSLVVKHADGTLKFAKNEPRGNVVTICLPIETGS